MRGEQEHHDAVGLIGRELIQAVIDVGLPVVAGVQAVLVEPGRMAAGLEVAVQPFGKRNVLVTAVADEDAAGA